MQLARLTQLTFLDLLDFQSLIDQSDSWGWASMIATSTTKTEELIDFRKVYRDLGPGVRRIGIYKAQLSPGDAEDFVHEVFERLWRSRHRFRGESTTKTWVYSFAYNVARNQLKVKKPRIEADTDCDTLQADGSSSPEERAMRGEAEAQFSLAVSELEEEERRLFIMYLSSGNVAETAELCGLSYSNADYLMRTTRTKLTKILARLQSDRGWSKR
jgi:RNA polymerase sigma-70 factor, ECF subfamily